MTLTKPEKPSRATRRPGKKSVDWRFDPEILQRLATVAELMNKGLKLFEIAKETKTSLTTAKRDMARVKELWKADALEQISHAADVAIAAHTAVIRKAWQDVEALKPTHSNRPALLNVILRAREKIDKIIGIPDPISGPGGGPIPVEVVDMDSIRKKRWDGIAGSLAELAKKGQDDQEAKQ